MGINARFGRTLLRNALVTAVALVAAGAGAAAAHNDHGHHGFGNPGHHRGGGGGGEFGPLAVYTQTNNPAGNAVIVFTRHEDGTITQREVVPTGGLGRATQPPFGFPITDSQGSVLLTDGGRLLFVVNAGDNTVSSFRVTAAGPQLVDHISSGGMEPISLTASRNLLYVLDEQSGNIYGYHFSRTGQLTPIPGSTQSLSTPGPSSIAAQIGFSPNGRVLTVTERCYFGGCPGYPHGVLDTFRLRRDDTPGPAHRNPSNADGPFGFAYHHGDDLLVSNTGPVGNPADLSLFTGTASSYDLARSGTLRANGNIPTGGRGACWVVITNNQRYSFITNSLSATSPGSGQGGVSRLRIGPDGRMTLLGLTNTGTGFPTDEALSADSRYLYVLVPTLGMTGGDVSHIDVYRVGPDGSLTHIQASPNTLPSGVSGLAAF